MRPGGGKQLAHGDSMPIPGYRQPPRPGPPSPTPARSLILRSPWSSPSILLKPHSKKRDSQEIVIHPAGGHMVIVGHQAGWAFLLGRLGSGSLCPVQPGWWQVPAAWEGPIPAVGSGQEVVCTLQSVLPLLESSRLGRVWLLPDSRPAPPNREARVYASHVTMFVHGCFWAGWL